MLCCVRRNFPASSRSRSSRSVASLKDAFRTASFPAATSSPLTRTKHTFRRCSSLSILTGSRNPSGDEGPMFGPWTGPTERERSRRKERRPRLQTKLNYVYFVRSVRV
uniref:(northern house mosquito) hypothetical protein n=1 Tax=Culex pipiens TaxID=7175 RepID=A0A8D8GVJ9_CULPI